MIFQEKHFLCYVINWRNFINRLLLLLEILGNMCISFDLSIILIYFLLLISFTVSSGKCRISWKFMREPAQSGRNSHLKVLVEKADAKKSLQTSLEHTCDRDSFLSNLQGWNCNFIIKMDCIKGVLLWILQIYSH